MGFDDFIAGLMDAALGGNDAQAAAPMIPTATPNPVPVAQSANQLPPEIIAALTGPFKPASQVGGLTRPPVKPTQSYQIPEGEVAGPSVPLGLTTPDAQYGISSEMLPYELDSYQYNPSGSDMRLIFMPDTQRWTPVPVQIFQTLVNDGIVDGQGTPIPIPELPDLENPSEEDINTWQQALPAEMLADIKLDAEREVTLFTQQLEQLYNDQGRTYDENGELINEQLQSNKIQELETKLKDAEQEVSEYEALQYILYGVEPPESKKEWLMNNIVSPIMSGVGKFFSFADFGRSQLGRRVGGFIAARLAGAGPGGDIESAVWYAWLRSNGFGQLLLAPLAIALSETNQDVKKIYEEEGSVGVWEKVIAGTPNEQNWPAPIQFAWSAFTDTVYDPLTYLPGAALAAKAIRGSQASTPLMRGVASVVEPTLRYTDIVTSLPGTVVYRGGTKAARAVKTATTNAPYWKLGQTFAPSRGGEAKLLREAMGASAHKLEQAVDEYDSMIIGKSGGPGSSPPNQGGITPFPPAPQGGITPVPGGGTTPPGTPSPTPPGGGTTPPIVGGLTQEALTGTPTPRVAVQPGGPQVIGQPQPTPQMGIGRQKPAGNAPKLTNLEKTVQLIQADPNVTPQTISKKLKVPIADARELLPAAQTAYDTMRGPVKLYPSKVPGLQPYNDGTRVIDRGYQSYLRGEESGRRFIEEINPILQKYEADPVYNSRIGDPIEDAEFGAKAWSQKARAMTYVGEIASVYAKHFDDLNTINVINPSYRGDFFGGTPGGLKNEFTDALLEEYALGDHTAKKLSDIRRILTNTAGQYVEVTNKEGRIYNRSIGGLKNSDTGELFSYADDLLKELEAARNTFEDALSASKKAPKAPKQAEVATGDLIAQSDIVEDAEIERQLDVILDDSVDDKTADEVISDLPSPEEIGSPAYTASPSGGMSDVDTVIIVEDQPVNGKESVELIDTDDGQAVVIHKPKPSRATQQRRKEAAKAVADLSRKSTDVVDDPVVKADLVNDPDIPSTAQVMTPEQLVAWRRQNIGTTVITGDRGQIIEVIQKDSDEYLPSEGEFTDAIVGRKPEADTPASTNPDIAQPRPATATPADPNTLFPTQQDLYTIGTEQAWRDAGLNIPDASGKKPVSYANFRSNVTPRPSTDLSNMDNKHVRYFRKYLARMHGLPKTALLDNGNGFAQGYEAYEEATKVFWDAMVRYAKSTRVAGMWDGYGLEERGFFKRAPGKIAPRPPKAELTDTQKKALDVFEKIFDTETYAFDEAQIVMPEIGIDGRPMDVGVDMLGVPGTNAKRGSGRRWDFTPKGVWTKDISYAIEATSRPDIEALGSDTLQDMSLALDVEELDNAGKLVVMREIFDPKTDTGEDAVIGFATTLDEARLMIIKDLKLTEITSKPPEPKTKSTFQFNRDQGIVGPYFQQIQDVKDMLNSAGYAANQDAREVAMEKIPAYAPKSTRNDAINYGGKIGLLNNNEVQLWDKRIDLDLANDEFMDSAEKKLLGQIQAGQAVDPAKIAAMTQQQREFMIAMFGPAAGIKNPVSYPKRVVLTDKIMIDVLSRVDTSKLGKKSGQIYERLGQTAAQRSKIGNIYMAARKAGLDPKAAEDFVLKVSGLYVGPPGVMQNWDTAVRHAYMYNAVKAPFNVMQDSLNDAIVGVLDGDPDAVARWSKLFVEQVKSNVAGSEAKIVQRYKSADTPILDEIQAFNKALGEDIYPSVQSQRGGRYDDVAGRYVEEGRSWWETKGNSFGEWLDKSAFRGRTGTKMQTTFRNLGQVPAPSTVLRFRNSLDDMKRLGVDHTYATKHYGDTVDKFLREDLNRVARKAGKAKGVTMDGQLLLDYLMQGTGTVHYGMPVFSPADIRRILPQYVGQGQAEHLARRWSANIGSLKEAAAKQTDKLLYSYTPTNLDEQVSRLWMFHYWASRASATHARLALENPFVMAAYYRAFEGTKRAAEEHGDVVPGWAKLFLPLQAGPYGMLGLVSPAALLSGLSVVLDLQGVAPNDFSWVEALQTLPMRPVVSAAMAMTVSDRLPDPSGTAQTRKFVQIASNFFRNTGIAPVDPGLTDDYVNNAIYRMQVLSRGILDPLPGIGELTMPSPEEKDTQDVKFYAIQILQDQGKFIDPNTGQVSDEAASALANIDAGLYSGPIESEALRQFSIDSMYGQIGKSFLFASIYPSAEGRIRSLAREGRESQFDEALPDLTATPGGAGSVPEFLDPTPEITPEQEAAQLALRLGDSGGAEATEMIATMSQYKAIGTKDQQETYESMNDAIYEPSAVIKKKWGGDGISINENHFFTWEEWDGIGQAERREWINLWLQSNNLQGAVDDYIQDRAAFAASNPVIQPFLEWQGQVNELGPRVFLDRLLRDSESFRSWWKSRKVSKLDTRSVLMTESAYLAAMGDKPSLYDPVGTETSTSPNLDSVLPQTGAEANVPAESWASMSDAQRIEHLGEQERVYMVRLEQFNDKVLTVTGGTPYSALAPISKMDIDIRLERMGLSAPEPGGAYGKYIQWAQRQPIGVDRSIQAYVNSGASDQQS